MSEMKMKNVLKLVKHYSLICTFALIFGAEFFFAQVTGSLVLLLDSYHKLYVLLSLVLLVISCKLSDAQTLKNTFGWARIEILGSLFNMIFFAALCFSLAVECIQTMAHSGHEDVQPSYPLIMVVSGAVGILVHIILYFSVGDLMRKEGCYLSIAGNEVMVNFRVGKNDPDNMNQRNCDDPDEIVPFQEPETVSINRRKATKNYCSSADRGSTKRDMKQLRAINEEDESSDKLMESGTGSSNLPRIVPAGTLSQKQQPTDAALRRKKTIRNLISNFSSSLLLILSGLIVIYGQEQTMITKEVYSVADAVIAISAVALLSLTIYPMMKESGLILLQTIPKHIDVDILKMSLLQDFPEIRSIHDLHIWCLTSSTIIATCHVSLPSNYTDESYSKFSKSMNDFFSREGITSVTIQPEFSDDMEVDSTIDPDSTTTSPGQSPKTATRKQCLYTCSSSEDGSDCTEFKCCKEEEETQALIRGVQKINQSQRYTLSKLSSSEDHDECHC